jgi:hypothetical protein
MNEASAVSVFAETKTVSDPIISVKIKKEVVKNEKDHEVVGFVYGIIGCPRCLRR